MVCAANYRRPEDAELPEKQREPGGATTAGDRAYKSRRLVETAFPLLPVSCTSTTSCSYCRGRVTLLPYGIASFMARPIVFLTRP